jgi:hypothetical protein
MIPIPLEEPTRKELENKLMKMPELEEEMTGEKEGERKVGEEDEEVHIRLNDINTFMAHKNELCLRGTDEHGQDLTIWFDSYDFLGWIDTEQIEYIKKTLIKHIKKI